MVFQFIIMLLLRRKIEFYFFFSWSLIHNQFSFKAILISIWCITSASSYSTNDDFKGFKFILPDFEALGDIKEKLKNAYSLETLELVNNKFETIDDFTFNKASNLKELDLNSPAYLRYLSYI